MYPPESEHPEPLPHRGRRIDWSAVAATAAVVSTAVVLFLAVTLLREVRENRRWQHMTVALDTLRRFEEEWASDSLVASRSAAASALLGGKADTAVGDVLSFLDEIAYWIDRGALDEESVWYRFYWPMANYWQASRAYREEESSGLSEGWKHLESVLPRLSAIESRRRKDFTRDGVPDKEQVQDFLRDEAQADDTPCEEGEDQEVGMTPL